MMATVRLSERVPVFFDIEGRHREAAFHLVARSAFGSSTLRMFKPGAADLIRSYLIHRLPASRVATLRSEAAVDRVVDRLVVAFPRGVRKRGRGNRRPSFAQ